MRDICIAISSIRNSTAAGFYDKCSAVRALRVYLRPQFSLHRTENDNITLRPLKCRYHSDMEFSVYNVPEGLYESIMTGIFDYNILVKVQTLWK